MRLQRKKSYFHETKHFEEEHMVAMGLVLAKQET